MVKSRNVEWMNEAIKVAQSSPDPSVQNGAIIVSRENVIGIGCNKLTVGVKSTDERWERPAKYMWVEHAERNAIYGAAYLGNSTSFTEMYCPWASCCDCARAIVQAGISILYRLPMGEHEGWTDSIAVGDSILRSAGVSVIEIPLESVVVPDGLRLGQYR
jgi:dCMP deaminase